jgi:hypothetical protein
MVIGVRGRLLGLALLAEGATDVAPHGGAVLQKMLHLPTVERAGGLEHLLEVLRARTVLVGLRPSGAIDCGHHLLPTVLVLTGPLVAAALRRYGVVDVPTTKVDDSGPGLAAGVVLDGLLAGGILGGDV